jgi:2,4-dienoyl-CoA reductase-like NADH-dependent reductase (Old Yellow Enzyme family)
VRVSASDWVEGGLEVAEVAALARTLAGHGVDLIDVSSAGNDPRQQITIGESADAVLLGRVLLREPTWPQRAALELGHDLKWPAQYERGRP